MVNDPQTERQMTFEPTDIIDERQANPFIETTFTQPAHSVGQTGAVPGQEPVYTRTAPPAPMPQGQGRQTTCLNGHAGCFCAQSAYEICRGGMIERPPPPQYTK